MSAISNKAELSVWKIHKGLSGLLVKLIKGSLLGSTISRNIQRHVKLSGVKSIKANGLRHTLASFLIKEYNAKLLIIKDRFGDEYIKLQ